MEKLTIQFSFYNQPAIGWTLSFKSYLDYLEIQIAESKNSLYKAYLRSITSILYSNPVLLEPIKDWSILDSFHDLIDLIRLNHITDDSKAMYGIGIQAPIQLFSYSESFKELIESEDGHLKPYSQDILIDEEYYKRIYRDILYRCYGMTDFMNTSSQTLFRLSNDRSVYKKIFSFITNDQFAQIRCHETLPAIEKDWIEYVKGNIISYKDIAKPIPLERFSYEGFLLYTVKDTTLEESLNELRHNIATMHTLSVREAFSRIKTNTLSLLGKDDIEVGFLPLVEVNQKILYHRFFNYTSILTRIMKKYIPAISSNRFFEDFIYSFVSFDHSGIKLYNTTKEGGSEIENAMALEGIKNFAVVPVFNRKDLVGLIEIASFKNEIPTDSIRAIEFAIPMFREFIVYQTDKLHDQMDFFVKRNFSAIQPEIQWKFNEIAWQAIQYPKNTMPQIMFRDLIPFYGAVDIRNSSMEHRKAVFEDAILQFKNFQIILQERKEEASELLSKIEEWIQLINSNQAQEPELKEFLENITESVRLKFPDLNISTIHEAEDKYQRSIAIINKILKRELEAQERKLKNSIPVYFDKYRTDGWEYSIYVGQELNPWFQYPPDIISKMKRWEFETVLNMGLAAAKIRNRLPIQLETTQLILAQNNPVDIRFRLDEHRFDVEGSYSIRYEVIKKRIDKICLKENPERLTQPGKIAMVYLQPQEIETYLEVIKEYTLQGKLSDQIEYFDLEDVQGVTGLKAIRVLMKIEKDTEPS